MDHLPILHSGFKICVDEFVMNIKSYEQLEVSRC